MSIERKHKADKIGLVLSGGGARGAYQAGVIKALCEICLELKIENPFKIITGISAGAINASYLAATSHDLSIAGKNLPYLWENISTDQIFKINPFTMGRIGAQLVKQLTTGALTRQTPIKGLLDTSPLLELLEKYLKPEEIDRNLKNGNFEALAVTATNYINSSSTTFIHSEKKVNHWEKLRRQSIECSIGPKEVMASSAIPMLFPPHEVNGVYYGDGGVRNSSPISPAIHLGEDLDVGKLIVVGVNCNDKAKEYKEARATLDFKLNNEINSETMSPNLAKVLGVLINGILMDAVDTDIVRLKKMNKLLSKIKLSGAENKEELGYRTIDHLWLSPSKYLGEIAGNWMEKAPKMLKYLVGGLGSPDDNSDLMSYLLFESEYCSELVELGYNDTLLKKQEFKNLLFD